jgi:hypothetical protein
MTAPVIFYPKRTTSLRLLLISAIFVAIGISMVRSGVLLGYFAAAFFGLGIFVALVQMLPGSSFLRIDAHGITCSSLFRKWFIAWADIKEFYVVTVPTAPTRPMVGFNYVASYRRSPRARAFSKSIGGCEGALPDTYGKKANDLATLLNARLDEARARAVM